MYYTIATDASCHFGLEAHSRQGTSQFGSIDVLHVRTTHQLQDDRCGQVFTRFYIDRLTEVLINEFLFRASRLKLLVVLRQAENLVAVEPVAEALAVERIGLTIDTFIVERTGQRALDALHLEGQPAARARRVREELHVVTRAAERCQVWTRQSEGLSL